jgi:hypothetical protein
MHSWTLVDPLHDIDDIVMLGQWLFKQEGLTVLKDDPQYFRQCLTVTAVNQMFDRSKEFLAVCKDGDKLLGYCWFDRGGYATYSRDEISNAKFHHVDLELPVRLRVRLINEMIDQHILWAHTYRIPVVCSTSIRADNDGFMKIHKKRGFTVNGSYAWLRTEDGIGSIFKEKV